MIDGAADPTRRSTLQGRCDSQPNLSCMAVLRESLARKFYGGRGAVQGDSDALHANLGASIPDIAVLLDLGACHAFRNVNLMN